MKNGRTSFFSELKTLIHELTCDKKKFHPAPIKNDNAAVAMRKTTVRREQSEQFNKFINWNT